MIMKLKDEKCGCGKPAKYLGQDGNGACNKYGRCPTYEELQVQERLIKNI